MAEPKETWPRIVEALVAPSQLVICVLVGLTLGNFLATWFPSWQPWIQLFGAVLGLVVGTALLIRRFKKET